MKQFSFALGRMPPNADGWRDQALIILDDKTDTEIARVRYDDAARLIIAALGLAHSTPP